MTQQLLDHAKIDARFQQMGGETVPQRVHADPLRDARLAARLFEEMAGRGEVVTLVRRCCRETSRAFGRTRANTSATAASSAGVSRA